MTTSFARSKDSTRIAFDVTGSGPAIVLLHGGRQSRAVWHQAGYVDRLRDHATLVTIDLRGHGDSGKPVGPGAYTIEHHIEDVLAVTDQLGIDHFGVWGYSLGANIGRYLAACSTRVRWFAMIGVPFGPGAQGSFRQMLEALRQRWQPVLDALARGESAPHALSEQEQAYLQSGRAGAEIGWLTAMLDWTAVEPEALLAPTLWVVGDRNAEVLEDARQRQSTLGNASVQLNVIAGLDHEAELTDIDRVYPHVEAFIRFRTQWPADVRGNGVTPRVDA
jgi:pimeloyl-ACP methyl ester carboxylesterase